MALSRARLLLEPVDAELAHTAAPGISELPLPAVSIIGLGYVGVVSVGCLASRGFRVVGADIDIAKVSAIAAGRSPITEHGLEKLLATGVRRGLVKSTHDIAKAVAGTDVTILAVGTPTASDGGCDLSYVRAACRSIGAALAAKSGYHCVILRCSVPPGTTLGVAVPEITAASGKRLGADFGVCFSPEFLREGSAVADFDDPAKIVIAASDSRAEAAALRVIAAPGQRVLTASIPAAETLKYVDNVWHATKVVFANEVGRLCKSLDIDSHEVMGLFVEDTKLNLSPYYLRPGFAFGGSCLPKEVRAAVHIAGERNVDLPLMASLLRSNAVQVDEASRLLENFRGRRLGMLGLTFKPGTDDLRESPMLDVLARLIEGGEIVHVFDPNVQSGPRLAGHCRALRAARPDLAVTLEALEKDCLVDSIDELMEQSDVVIVAHATDQFRTAVRGRRPDLHVIDIARLFADAPMDATYPGISW